MQTSRIDTSRYKLTQYLEPANYKFLADGGASERYNSGVARFSGTHLTVPIGAVSAKNEGTGSTATALALTATSADSIILRFYAIDTGYAISFSTGTEIYRTTETSNYVNIGLTYEASPGLSMTTGPADAPLDAPDDWVAWTIEIMPSTGGGAILLPGFKNTTKSRRVVSR